MSVRNVLFLCTGNSARSVLAECLLNDLGKNRFRAYSAGSYPAGKINPFTLEILEKSGYPTAGLRSKSWDEFAAPGAPPMDFVITVCDDAAGEVCPVWPGRPVSAHWGFRDPAAATGSDAEKREVFSQVFHQIALRIRLFLELPVDKLDHIAIERAVKDLGKADT